MTKVKQEPRSDADGSCSFSTRERTHWTVGVQKCDADIGLKIVHFEVVVDKMKTTCH